jgi:hypothetical protein
LNRPDASRPSFWRGIWDTVRHRVDTENYEIDRVLNSYKDAVHKRGAALVELDEASGTLRRTAIETRLAARDVMKRIGNL